MKTKYRIAAAILAVMLSLVIAVVAIAANTEKNATPEIKGFNLTMKENIYLDIAVDFQDLEATAQSYGVLIWEGAYDAKIPDKFTYETFESFKELYPEYAADLKSGDKAAVGGADCYVFSYTGLAAKQMTDYVYAVAYVQNAEGKISYSEPVKYSILQYADAMIANNAGSTNLLKAMLNYGAKAQMYFDYKTDKLATMGYAIATLKDANFDDGTKEALFAINGTVTANSAVEGSNAWYLVGYNGKRVLYTPGDVIKALDSNFTMQPVIYYADTTSVSAASGTYTYTFKLDNENLEPSSFSLGGVAICEIDADGKVTFNGAEIGTLTAEEQIFSFAVDYTNGKVSVYRDGYEVGTKTGVTFAGTTASLSGAITEENTYAVAGTAPERATEGGFIIYNAGGGTLPEDAPVAYTKDFTALPYELGAGTNTGKTFAGWYTTSTFDEGTFINHIPENAKGEVYHLYAKWVDTQVNGNFTSTVKNTAVNKYGNEYYYSNADSSAHNIVYASIKSVFDTTNNPFIVGDKITIEVELADVRKIESLSPEENIGFNFRLRDNGPNEMVSMLGLNSTTGAVYLYDGATLATISNEFTKAEEVTLEKVVFTLTIGEGVNGTLTGYDAETGVQIGEAVSVKTPTYTGTDNQKVEETNFVDWINNGATFSWQFQPGNGIAYDNLRIYKGEYIPELEGIPEGVTKITYNNVTVDSAWKTYTKAGEAYILPTNVTVADGTLVGWYTTPGFAEGTKITAIPASGAPKRLAIYAKAIMDPVFEETFQGATTGTKGTDAANLTAGNFSVITKSKTGSTAEVLEDSQGNKYIAIKTSSDPQMGVSSTYRKAINGDKLKLAGGKVTFMIDLATYDGSTEYCNFRIRGTSSTDVISLFTTNTDGTVKLGSSTLTTLIAEFQTIIVTLDAYNNTVTAYNKDGSVKAKTSFIVSGVQDTFEWFDEKLDNITNWQLGGNSKGLAVDNIKIYFGEYVPET